MMQNENLYSPECPVNPDWMPVTNDEAVFQAQGYHPLSLFSPAPMTIRDYSTEDLVGELKRRQREGAKVAEEIRKAELNVE